MRTRRRREVKRKRQGTGDFPFRAGRGRWLVLVDFNLCLLLDYATAGTLTSIYLRGVYDLPDCQLRFCHVTGEADGLLRISEGSFFSPVRHFMPQHFPSERQPLVCLLDLQRLDWNFRNFH
jgi:hypothetical protein